MKEIVTRLHENKQIELAKSILEAAGYTVTKNPLRESEGIISSFAERCKADGNVYLLSGVREDSIVGTQYDKEYDKMYKTISQWLGASEDKIYWIDGEGFNDTAGEIYQEFVDMGEAGAVIRLKHADIDNEEAGYHAGLALNKVKSTGEMFVSGVEVADGSEVGFFCIVSK